ncbi:choice-of-anchor O protein [Chloroflexota bacterium]
MKRLITILGIVALIAIVTAGLTLAADDGPLFRRNISGTPNTMTGASSMNYMSLYVPAQDTQGEPPETTSGELEYYAGDCTNQDTSGCDLVYTRPEAKPLIITYNDGMIEETLPAGIMTGAGFGERDAFAALSLDDGATWKNWNLSDSALRSSFVLRNGHDYPGDVFKMVQAVEGNRVAAAWLSRYCESGAPLYSWLDDEKLGLLTAYPELDHPVAVDGATDPYQLYTDDMFTVGGTQKSVNYTEQGFPEVGEIPYGCVWTARGTLEQALDDTGAPKVNTAGDPVYTITWRAAERLTSGRRDPHQISITSSPGAGFVIFWQEDPNGLRPGKGLGPGEGWSGAIANSKTDIWYTYLDLAHFGDVCTDDVEDTYCTPGTLAEFNTSELFGQKPKIAVPFAMPVRITDNNACKGVQKFDPSGELIDAYCYADFDGSGTADACAATISWTNPGGTTIEVCQTEDGRTLTGRTASTRVRAAMKSYDSDGDGAPDSSWVLFGAEKMKALGTVGDGGCDPTTDDTCTIFDIGKNMWYYTFEFDKPALVTQGMMLNSYALSPADGLPFDTYTDEWGNEIYDTEIARRFNLMVNSPAAAMASESKTMGTLIYKQGILFQGGPADIFTRRIVLPIDFDPAVDNPFAYENVECASLDDAGVATPADRLYPDGINPNYVLGLCPVDGMNVSATTLVRCDANGGTDCAGVFPYDTTYEEWYNDAGITLPKVLEWSQTVDNLNDASWVNPYDVSKGHRGFMDGDFVMMMYATAANWKANTTGNEAYQLYIRRSFDGGQTWTTLPADYTHWSPLDPDITVVADGTTTYEWYGGYGEEDYSVETTYAAGDFEQARNVSQLAGTRVTVLDPRYSPTGGMLKKDYTKLLCPVSLDGASVWENCGYTAAVYPEDIRDPSAFFATFETGDNSVVTVDTGTVPLDMYYSRASNFGDDWDEQDICAIDPLDSWYPSSSVVCDLGETEFRWDWLENGDELATEASVFGNSNGDRFYTVWNQELPLGDDLYADMDSEFRRIFYNLYMEAAPAAEIAFVSSNVLDLSKEQEVTLIGWARDFDSQGEGASILNHMWFDADRGTIYCEEKLPTDLPTCKIDKRTNLCKGCADENANFVCDELEVEYYECTKTTVIPAKRLAKQCAEDDLPICKVNLSYKVRDNDGHWSERHPDDSVAIYVFEHLYQNFLPATMGK